MIDITKINNILELLTEKELTSLEISASLGIAKDVLYPKLSIPLSLYHQSIN